MAQEITEGLDNPCDDCALSSRREFLAKTTLAAVAALLGAACGNGQIGAGLPTDVGLGTGTSGTTSSNGKLIVTVASFSALSAVGGVARVDGNTRAPVAVARTGASTFVALSMICPHQGTTVDIVSGGFFCPNHGARFTTSGSWAGGQPTSSLRSYPVVYDSTAGTLTIG
jgi:Rieske Fe-S protein